MLLMSAKATSCGVRARRRAGSLTSGAAAVAQPFLKWAGGKSQLLGQLEPFFPASITAYCEPFVGSGAVFFHLRARLGDFRACLCDGNAELINCYLAVRDRVEELMDSLDKHLREYRSRGSQYYYLVRSQHHLPEPTERASRMIFLNKTCFNGLWRVNGRGEFNVPIGSYRPDQVRLYGRENLLAASRALQGAELAARDFRDVLREVPSGAFAYLDPPYVPLSATANFTSYTREDFGMAEQEQLAACFAEAAERGARLMLSNSDTPAVHCLYQAFSIQKLQARRAVNCNGTRRGVIPEALVLSWGQTVAPPPPARTRIDTYSHEDGS